MMCGTGSLIQPPTSHSRTHANFPGKLGDINAVVFKTTCNNVFSLHSDAATGSPLIAQADMQVLRKANDAGKALKIAFKRLISFLRPDKIRNVLATGGRQSRKINP